MNVSKGFTPKFMSHGGQQPRFFEGKTRQHICQDTVSNSDGSYEGTQCKENELIQDDISDTVQHSSPPLQIYFQGLGQENYILRMHIFNHETF